MLLYVHRDHKDYYGRGAQDDHLGFHTQLLSSDTVIVRSVLLYVHRDRTDYWGRGAQDGHLH